MYFSQFFGVFSHNFHFFRKIFVLFFCEIFALFFREIFALFSNYFFSHFFAFSISRKLRIFRIFRERNAKTKRNGREFFFLSLTLYLIPRFTTQKSSDLVSAILIPYSDDLYTHCDTNISLTFN